MFSLPQAAMALKWSQSAMEAWTTSSRTSRSGCATRQGLRGSSMTEKWSRSAFRRDFSFEHGEGEAHHGGSRTLRPRNHASRNPLTAVNPSSEPWFLKRLH
jgi:hypothetical protein